MEILLFIFCGGFVVGLIVFAGWMAGKSRAGSLIGESFLLATGGLRSPRNSRGD